MVPQVSLTLARWSFFVATTILFGSSSFPIYAMRAGDRQLTEAHESLIRIALAFCAFAAACAWLWALALDIDSNAPVPATVKTILLQTSFGPPWIARLVIAFATIGAALSRRGALVALASGGLLICEGFDGHAAAHGLLGAFVQALHILCAGFWIGALFALLCLFIKSAALGDAVSSDHARRLRETVRRFSDAALAAVSLLAATGATNLLLIAPQTAQLGPYLRLLLTKLALFLVMVGLACLNRWRFMPCLVRGDERAAQRAMFVATLMEQALGVCILLVVAALGLVDPYMADMDSM